MLLAAPLLSLALLLARAAPCVQLRRLTVSEEALGGVRVVARVAKVANAASCAELCLREGECAAVRFPGPRGHCELLSARSGAGEGDTALANGRPGVPVWVVGERGSFGRCPPSYNLAWRAFRYRRVTDKRRWADAQALCLSEGGKLAELTTREEVSSFGEHVRGQFWMFGGVKRGQGWEWFFSGLPVNEESLGALHTDNPSMTRLVAWHHFKSGLRFIPAREKQSFNFFCECQSLT